MKTNLTLAALSAAALLAGCSTTGTTGTAGKAPEPTYEQAAANSFTTANQKAIAELVKRIDASYRGDAPVLVATVVNVNNLGTTAPLGRTISEQFASAMVSNGFNVKEMKLRDSIFIREETGELMLSRELKDIARAHKASLVVVGTYSAADSMTFVNVRAVRTQDGRIVAAHDYALPNDKDVRRMLVSTR